jgi:hypothetical protein
MTSLRWPRETRELSQTCPQIVVSVGDDTPLEVIEALVRASSLVVAYEVIRYRERRVRVRHPDAVA